MQRKDVLRPVPSAPVPHRLGLCIPLHLHQLTVAFECHHSPQHLRHQRMALVGRWRGHLVVQRSDDGLRGLLASRAWQTFLKGEGEPPVVQVRYHPGPLPQLCHLSRAPLKRWLEVNTLQGDRPHRLALPPQGPFDPLSSHHAAAPPVVSVGQHTSVRDFARLLAGPRVPLRERNDEPPDVGILADPKAFLEDFHLQLGVAVRGVAVVVQRYLEAAVVGRGGPLPVSTLLAFSNPPAWIKHAMLCKGEGREVGELSLEGGLDIVAVGFEHRQLESHVRGLPAAPQGFRERGTLNQDVSHPEVIVF
eukprot:Sspe_Gene.65692::Locus_38856_Transcript_1_1_Confidence_1.000_Length_5439::g.65692::m.65692